MLDLTDKDLSDYLEWMKTNLKKDYGCYDENQLSGMCYSFIRSNWFRSYYCGDWEGEDQLYLMLDQKWKDERDDVGKHYQGWFRKNNLDWKQGQLETDRTDLETLVELERLV